MAMIATGNKSDFKVLNSIEFYRNDFISIRAELCTIAGKPYVGIARFWKPEGQDSYVPTKKSIFLSAEQWRLLGSVSGQVNRSLSSISIIILIEISNFKLFLKNIQYTILEFELFLKSMLSTEEADKQLEAALQELMRSEDPFHDLVWLVIIIIWNILFPNFQI